MKDIRWSNDRSDDLGLFVKQPHQLGCLGAIIRTVDNLARLTLGRQVERRDLRPKVVMAGLVPATPITRHSRCTQ